MKQAQRILFLVNTQLTVLYFAAGQLVTEACFDLDEAGEAALQAYLQTHSAYEFSLLVDIVEEEFQLETIPHLAKVDRHALLERRLEHYFRNTPYRRYAVQKIAKKGEQDKVLLSGLNAVTAIDMVVNTLLANKGVLKGIYSAALLAGELMHRSGLEHSHYLLVSFVAGAGMRQTYIAADGVKFSRVSSLPEGFDLQDAERVAELIVQECSKARQYLSTLRLLGRDDLMQLVVVAPTGLACQVEITQRLQANGEAGHFALNEVALGLWAQKLRLGQPDSLLGLLCSYLLVRPPPNHYGQARHFIYASWKKWGRIACSISFAILVLAGVWGGLAMQQAAEVQNSIKQTLQQTTQTDQRLRRFSLLLKQLKGSDPAAMKGVNTLYTEQLMTWPDIELMLQQLSQILLEFPELSLDELRWLSGRIPTEASVAEAAASETAAEVKQAVVLELQGRVEPFSLQYRQALSSVNRLSARLASLPKVKVETLKLPLDTRPNQEVEGKPLTGTDDAQRVDFVLRLVWDEP